MIIFGRYSHRIVLASIALLLMAFGTSPAFANKDTLVLAVGGENAEGYDPLLGWGSYGNPLFQSTLLKRDADLNIVPDLATQWELSKDRKVWTLKIRNDVKFSDGSPLTAKDVAFTFNKGLEAGGKIDLSPLAKAEALDDTTVRLTLSQPDITFIQHILTLGIVPQKLYTPITAEIPSVPARSSWCAGTKASRWWWRPTTCTTARSRK